MTDWIIAIGVASILLALVGIAHLIETRTSHIMIDITALHADHAALTAIVGQFGPVLQANTDIAGRAVGLIEQLLTQLGAGGATQADIDALHASATAALAILQADVAAVNATNATLQTEISKAATTPPRRRPDPVAFIGLRATIDPVLAEHYPGLGMQVRTAPNNAPHDGFILTLRDGRQFDLSWGATVAACQGEPSGWERLFDEIDKAIGRPSPVPVEYVEVPVTRRARVTLIGRLRWERSYHVCVIEDADGKPLDLPSGLRFVLRPHSQAPIRSGIGLVRAHDGHIDLTAIPAAMHGDLLYRVEPE